MAPDKSFVSDLDTSQAAPAPEEVEGAEMGRDSERTKKGQQMFGTRLALSWDIRSNLFFRDTSFGCLPLRAHSARIGFDLLSDACKP